MHTVILTAESPLTNLPLWEWLRRHRKRMCVALEDRTEHSKEAWYMRRQTLLGFRQRWWLAEPRSVYSCVHFRFGLITSWYSNCLGYIIAWYSFGLLTGYRVVRFMNSFQGNAGNHHLNRVGGNTSSSSRRNHPIRLLKGRCHWFSLFPGPLACLLST